MKNEYNICTIDIRGKIMNEVYEKVKEFKKNYPSTVTWWRLKKHASIVEKHLNKGEKVLYAFAGQKNKRSIDMFQTCVVVLTNERILIGQKRVTPGYFLTSIAPYLYNDLTVKANIIWGMVIIDTVKEVVFISNLSKSSLAEIETTISTYMLKRKKLYPDRAEEAEE